LLNFFCYCNYEFPRIIVWNSASNMIQKRGDICFWHGTYTIDKQFGIYIYIYMRDDTVLADLKFKLAQCIQWIIFYSFLPFCKLHGNAEFFCQCNDRTSILHDGLVCECVYLREYITIKYTKYEWLFE